MNVIPFLELFSSYQGEGPNTGRLSTFLRVSGCNLRCVFCDTKKSWSNIPPTGQEITPLDLVRKMVEDGSSNLVITGGEPLLYAKELVLFLDDFNIEATQQFDVMPTIEIETNGTLLDWALYERCDNINVSLKLSNSGVEESCRLVDDTIDQILYFQALYNNVQFKFVVGGVEDIKEVEQIVELYNIPKSSVWLMPLGTDSKKQLVSAKAMSRIAFLHKYNISLRTHILLDVK